MFVLCLTKTYRIALATPGLLIIEGRPWPGNSRSRSPLVETVPDHLQPDLEERHCSLNTCTVHTHHVPHSTLHTPHSTLGRFSHRVAISVCLSVCLSWQFKTPSSGGCWDFWSKGVLLILDYNDTILVIFPFNDFLRFSSFTGFGASLLWASLLRIMGKLAGGGSRLPPSPPPSPHHPQFFWPPFHLVYLSLIYTTHSHQPLKLQCSRAWSTQSVVISSVTNWLMIFLWNTDLQNPPPLTKHGSHTNPKIMQVWWNIWKAEEVLLWCKIPTLAHCKYNSF